MVRTEFNAIAISGQAGSGKTTVANEVGSIMGWDVVGAGGKFRAFRSKSKNIGASAGSESEHDSIDTAMLEILKRGQSVAEGRVAGLVAWQNKLPRVSRVFLVCDAEERYERIWRRDRDLYSSFDEVREVTRIREADNLRIFSDRFDGLSYLDQSLYHLTINTGTYDLKSTLEQVLGAIGVN